MHFLPFFGSVFDVSLTLETCFCIDCHQIFRGISYSTGEYWFTSKWMYGSKALWGWESKMLWSIISWLELDKACSWAQNWYWVSYDSGQHFSWREEFQFKFRGKHLLESKWTVDLLNLGYIYSLATINYAP